MKAYIIVFLCFVPCICFCDTIYIPKGEWLENKDISFKWENISIDTDIRFHGYLIIKFDDVSLYKDSLNDKPYPLPFKIYWVDSLSDLNTPSKYYWYFYNLGNIVQSVYNKKETSADEYNFCKYYVIFYSNLDWKCLPPIFDELKSNIYTTILDSVNIWEKDNSFYAIFNCFFFGAQVISINERFNRITGSDTLKTLLPLSHYSQFYEISIQDALRYNFNKSNLKIITYDRNN